MEALRILEMGNKLRANPDDIKNNLEFRGEEEEESGNCRPEWVDFVSSVALGNWSHNSGHGGD